MPMEGSKQNCKNVPSNPNRLNVQRIVWIALPDVGVSQNRPDTYWETDIKLANTLHSMNVKTAAQEKPSARTMLHTLHFRRGGNNQLQRGIALGYETKKDRMPYSAFGLYVFCIP